MSLNMHFTYFPDLFRLLVSPCNGYLKVLDLNGRNLHIKPAHFIFENKKLKKYS